MEDVRGDDKVGGSCRASVKSESEDRAGRHLSHRPSVHWIAGSHGVIDEVDVVAVHGFPLDWNHWSIHDWPSKVAEIRRVTRKSVWVSEAEHRRLARKRSRFLA